jgi:protein TonB
MEQAPPKEAPPAPPSQELKMDGPAGNGPSAFAAGKVTRDEFPSIGKGGAGAPAAAPQVNSLFNPFANYATAIKGELQRQLARIKELRQQAYQVDLHLWVGRDGRVTRHELLGSTGDTDIDEMIRQALAGIGFSMLPPDQMPQPIRLRVVTGRR